MTVRYWLARLGGADADVLRAAHTEAPRYTAMGGVLISTAAVAAASAAFALTITFDLGVEAATIVGVMWGLVILNLDRMLIVSMGRQKGLWRSILTSIPRLALAVIIGAVISTPLVLQIFDPEIDAQLVQMRIEQRNELQSEVAARDEEIAALQATKADREAAARSLPSADSDQGVQAAQQRVDAAAAEFTTALDKYNCELGGRPECSGRAGPGPIADGLRLDMERKKQVVDDATADLENARAAAGLAIADREQDRQADLTTEIERLERQIDEQSELRDGLARQIEDATAANTGLLARLEALDRLTADNRTMQIAHLALFLLFLCVEVLPVLAKLLSMTSSPGPYDRLLERREEEAIATDEVWANQQKQIAEHRASVRVALEKDRADQQVEAGRRANALRVETQSAIAAKAIERWGAVAAARSDEQLARWYRDQTRPAPHPVVPPVAGPSTNGHAVPAPSPAASTPPVPAQPTVATAAPAPTVPAPVGPAVSPAVPADPDVTAPLPVTSAPTPPPMPRYQS